MSEMILFSVELIGRLTRMHDADKYSISDLLGTDFLSVDQHTVASLPPSRACELHEHAHDLKSDGPL